ncbi:hypothetical protein [Streptomyces sp. NPDC046712]|uniref:hypothetical protein n=1 Tax=Streptomyces sp. NPDC046712 TaxID=3154802 RepID=UPI0033EE53E0
MITHMMCEFAHLVTMAREAEGLEAALDHLAQADAVVASVPDGREGFAPWFERGTVHYRRARAPAQAERFEGALDEAQAATVAHEQGGEDGEVSREEAVRIGALVEGQGLEHFNEAVARLTTAAARCRKAGIPDAAQILDALREDYMSR